MKRWGIKGWQTWVGWSFKKIISHSDTFWRSDLVLLVLIEIEKAKMLSKKLGFETEICSPMTLAGVYNQEEIGFEDGRKFGGIGFRAGINK